MKKVLLTMSAIAAIMLSSCDSTAKLAKEVEGSWSGVPVKLVDESAASAMIIESYIFSVDSSGRSGDIVVGGMISTTSQMPQSQDVVQPFSITGSAKSIVYGSWTAVDDDEINVNLSPESLSVTVDPDATELVANMATGATAPELETMKPQIAQSMKNQLTAALQLRYASIKHLDDVKVKGNVLKFEIGHDEYTFSRQGGIPQ